MRDAAWAIVAPLVNLSAAEREYVDRIQAGELCPELLFPDDGVMSKRLRRHPALLWRVENAKRHRQSRR